MNVPTGRSLLYALDHSVWVRKRLFAPRLIILDSFVRRTIACDFIFDLLNELLYLDSDWNSNNDQLFVDLLAQSGLAELLVAVLSEYGKRPPDSVITQFVIDLDTFGLREALAYIIESKDGNVPEELVQKMIVGYQEIGMAFNFHKSRIRAALFRQTQRALGKEDLPDCLDRLLVRQNLSFDGPWKDGQEQENLSEFF